MKHTREPWKVLRNDENDKRAKGSFKIATDYPSDNQKVIQEVFKESNARRVVECVNALAGIPDPSKAARALGLIALHLSEGRAIEPGSLVADAVKEAVEGDSEVQPCAFCDDYVLEGDPCENELCLTNSGARGKS